MPTSSNRPGPNMDVLPIKVALRAGISMQELIIILRASGISYAEAVFQFRKRWIIQELDACNGNQVHAADRLRMHPNTLSRAMHDLDIDSPRNKRGKPAKTVLEKLAPEGARTIVPFGDVSTERPLVKSVRKGGRGESPEPAPVSAHRSHTGAVDCGGLTTDPEDSA